ncbi:hypothetical protein QJQ45_019254 [Haematococcus lacustris]|nr:hypothetical protein QJQ45_019254 [Haematococcus lacustris]
MDSRPSFHQQGRGSRARCALVLLGNVTPAVEVQPTGPSTIHYTPAVEAAKSAAGLADDELNPWGAQGDADTTVQALQDYVGQVTHKASPTPYPPAPSTPYPDPETAMVMPPKAPTGISPPLGETWPTSPPANTPSSAASSTISSSSRGSRQAGSSTRSPRTRASALSARSFQAVTRSQTLAAHQPQPHPLHHRPHTAPCKPSTPLAVPLHCWHPQLPSLLPGDLSLAQSVARAAAEAAALRGRATAPSPPGSTLVFSRSPGSSPRRRRAASSPTAPAGLLGGSRGRQAVLDAAAPRLTAAVPELQRPPEYHQVAESRGAAPLAGSKGMPAFTVSQLLGLQLLDAAAADPGARPLWHRSEEARRQLLPRPTPPSPHPLSRSPSPTAPNNPCPHPTASSQGHQPRSLAPSAAAPILRRSLTLAPTSGSPALAMAGPVEALSPPHQPGNPPGVAPLGLGRPGPPVLQRLAPGPWSTPAHPPDLYINSVTGQAQSQPPLASAPDAPHFVHFRPLLMHSVKQSPAADPAACPSGSSAAAGPSGSSSSNKRQSADIRSGLAENRAFQFDPAAQMGMGLDPGTIQAVSAASGAWVDDGCLQSFYHSKLTRSQVQHDSGLIQAHRKTMRWDDNVKLELQHLAAATPAGTSLVAIQRHVAVTLATWDAVWGEYLHPKWAEQRIRLNGAQEKVLERFFKKLDEEAASVSQQQWGTRKQLVVFFGNACSGTRGGWGAKAVLQACRKVVERANSGRPTDKVKCKVVTVDEFRTSRVNSALNNPQPCREELDRSKPTSMEGWKSQPGQAHNNTLS